MPIYDYNRSLKCLCTFTQGLYLIYCSVVPRILGSLQTMFSVKRKNSHQQINSRATTAPPVTATRHPQNSRKLNISVNFINTCGESVVGCDSTWIALAYQLQLKQFSRRWSSQSKSAIRNISSSKLLGLIFPKIAFLITFHTKLWGKSSI